MKHSQTAMYVVSMVTAIIAIVHALITIGG